MEQKPKQNSIKNWAEADRPREKLVLKGRNALSDAELLAILINTGTNDRSALDIARDILQHVNYNLYELGNLELDHLKNFKGMGEAKAITIAAALELGRRRQSHTKEEQPIVKSSSVAFNLLRPYLENLQTEAFYAIFLNNRMEPLRIFQVGTGGIGQVTVDIRVLFKQAVTYNATSIIVAHNHPSGTLTPSKADIDITKQIKQAGELLQIRLHDHIIIGANQYLSMADEGIL